MRKIFAGLVVGLVGVLLLGGEVFASTIGGNGNFSHNSVYTSSFAYSGVTQSNVANISNNVKVGKAGKGSWVGFNTGGSVDVSGGDVTNTVSVNNVVNSNTNTLSDPCCLCGQPVDVTITGNGSYSWNSVYSSSKCVTKVEQVNVASISNSVEVSGTSGGADVVHNTNADVTVIAGDSTTSVTVNNVANTNSSL